MMTLMKVIACFAATLDGRIASARAPRDRIGSEADLQHLLNVRNQADAILCGGETFREYPNVRRGSTGNVPLQCLLSRSLDLPDNAPLFQADPPPEVIIFTPAEPSEMIRNRYPHPITWVGTQEHHPVPAILDTLAARGIKTLLVEGGGHVMNLFLQTQAVHELYLTLCPLMLGGRDDPGLVTGPGFAVKDAPRTEILSLKQVGNELYLHLAIRYPGQ